MRETLSSKGPLVIYRGIGETLEQAVQRAHDQIPPRQGRDYAVSRVIDWGMQRGGFTGARSTWVHLVEEEDAPFKSEAPP